MSSIYIYIYINTNIHIIISVYISISISIGTGSKTQHFMLKQKSPATSAMQRTSKLLGPEVNMPGAVSCGFQL